MFNIVKNVARHSVIYGLSDVLGRAVGFFMIPLYTYYLTPADYGILELLDLTCYVVGMLVAMGISQAVVKFFYEYTDQDKRDQMISVAFITLWVVSAVALGALFVGSRQISNFVFQTKDYYYLFNIIFVSTIIGLSNEIPLTLLRIKEKSIMYVSISLCRLALNLTLNILFIVKFKMGIVGILYSSLISSSLVAVFVTFFTLKRLKLSFSFAILRSMLVYGIPLGWGTLGMFVINFSDRFFLQRLTTLSDVGLYSLAYKFGMLPNIIVLSPFIMIWGPKRFELLKEPDAKDIYSAVFTYFMLIEIFVVLGLAVLIKDVIYLIAEPHFHQAYKYVPILLLAYIANAIYIYVQFGVHIENKTKYLAYTNFLGAIINVAGNLILIPLLGVWGAAISTLVSFLFLAVCIYLPSQKLYYIKYEWKRILHMGVTAAALFIIASFVTFSNLTLSISVKTLIAFSFPFVLGLTRFYSDREMLKIKLAVSTATGFLKSKTSRKETK
jgi:O-antigen/teichoic acid export membrane protein